MRKFKPNNSRVLLLLTIYVLFLGLARILFSDGIEVDEAEQSYLSQWLLLGYNIQPPLYTWLQMAFFEIFGNKSWVHVYFRMLLLLFTLYGIFLIFSQISNNKQIGLAAVIFSLLLIQFSTESLRQTHTVLVTLAGVGSIWCLLQIYNQAHLSYYILLGISLTVGILAKYNFLFFIVSICLTTLLLPNWRSLILSQKSLPTIAIVILLTSPHFFWVWQHLDVLTEGTNERMSSNEIVPAFSTRFKGILEVLQNIFAFLSVFLIVFALLHFHQLKSTFQQKSEWTTFFEYFFSISTIQFFFIVIIFNASIFPQRWIQPFFIFFPGYCLLKLHTKKISSSLWKKYKRIGILAALTVCIVIITRTAILPSFKKPIWLNKPHTQFCKDLRPLLEENKIEVVVTNHILLAGFLRMVYPNLLIATLDPKYKLVNQYDSKARILYIWTWAWVEDVENGVEKGATPPFIQQAIQQHNRTPVYGKMLTYDYHYCPTINSSYNYIILK